MQVPRTSSLTRSRRFVKNRSLALGVLKPGEWRSRIAPRKPELVVCRASRRRLISYVLFTIGGVLCTYVAGNYTWMYAEQRKLMHEWRAQNASLPSQDGPLTRLSIPRIHLRAVVLEGTSRRSLLLGPGHLTGSADPGAVGNSVIAGHRDTFFRHVHSLKYGDDIYVQKSRKLFHYVVTSKKVVEPTDLSVLQASKTGELTLITCYPTHAIGPAPQRLVVVARLAPGN